MFQKPELVAMRSDLHWKSIVLSVLKMRGKAKKKGWKSSTETKSVSRVYILVDRF